MPETINIRGTIGWDPEATSEHLQAQLEAAGGRDVMILINSPGGFVFDGIEMANMIRDYTGITTAVVKGFAASTASYIPMLADRMEIEDNAVFMIHNAWGVSFGDSREMAKSAAIFESIDGLLARAYAQKTGKEVAEIRHLMNQESFFFGEEARESGFADDVLHAGEGAEDQATAMQIARVAVATCGELVRSKNDATQITKIAAMLGDMPKAVQSEPKSKPEPEAQKMTLAELLKNDPEAKAEYDAQAAEHDKQLTEAKAQGAAGITDALAAARVALNSDAYPQALQGPLLDLVAQANTVGVQAAIGVHDQLTEAAKSQSAQNEPEKETPAEEQKGSGDGVINSQDGVDETIARLDNQTQPRV